MNVAIDPANEKLYNNRAAVPNHMEIIESWAAQSVKARSDTPCTLAVPYGDSARQIIDIFHASSQNAPILVFIHGGYWQGLDPSFFSFIAPELTKAGFCVANVGYDLCPDVRVDDISSQMRQAIRHLYLNAEIYNADRDRIFVSGHSAGGHLTAEMMATDWPKLDASLPTDLVKGGVPISGLFDLTPLLNTSINEKVGMNQDDAVRNSPILRMPTDRMPMVVIVGGNETPGFHEQADRLEAAWGSALSGITRLNVDGCDHFTVVGEMAKPDSNLYQAITGLI